MWVGTGPSGNPILGDSLITQLNGNLGIGITTPASKLAVGGTIESTLGGYKFPDGTLQTTAAVSGLQAITHDATLQGNGTGSSPLGLAVPLTLNGPSGSLLFFGNGMQVEGSHAPGGTGAHGLKVFAGNGLVGGNGVIAIAGDSVGVIGGTAVEARGGHITDLGFGGHGVRAVGGDGIGPSNTGGVGIIAIRGLGHAGAANGLAGEFTGDVNISGHLSKSSGSFKIDHPLDPENKYLYHSFVESPDMKNIYDGTVTTDASGTAVVLLPDYFEALNSDFRYQLTVIGTFAQAVVAQEIQNNRFTIRTNAAHVKVSWQVTGIRQDAYANKHRIKVEENKPERERGFFLHPEVFERPEERGVEWARNPELMQQVKESRLKRVAERGNPKQ
jgi:hypothetical protein